MREHIVLVHILQNGVEKGIVYFFWQIMFRAILLLTFGLLDNISIFFDSHKIRISLFYMREHIELVYIYTPKQSRKGHCIFLLTEYFQRKFAFYLGEPILYLDFFDSHKIKISVFYVREHIELVYILQNRVQECIIYFFWEIILRAILFLTLRCLNNILIFSIRVKLEVVYFTWESILSWFIFYNTE